MKNLLNKRKSKKRERNESKKKNRNENLDVCFVQIQYYLKIYEY